MHQLPETGFLRVKQILGDPKANPPLPALIPVARSTWWAGIRAGRYPRPIKLGTQTTCWRVEDIRELIQRLSNPEPAAPASARRRAGRQG